MASSGAIMRVVSCTVVTRLSAQIPSAAIGIASSAISNGTAASAERKNHSSTASASAAAIPTLRATFRPPASSLAESASRPVSRTVVPAGSASDSDAVIVGPSSATSPRALPGMPPLGAYRGNTSR